MTILIPTDYENGHFLVMTNAIERVMKSEKGEKRNAGAIL
jgi:hypothetical protein